MATVQEIANENQVFLESLEENRGKLFQLIRTMSRFHRYEVQAQITIAIHAPFSASAYATAAIWNRLGRTVSEGAESIEIDNGGAETVKIYEVNNTIGPKQSFIWRFDKRNDEVIFSDLEPANATVPVKIAELCKKSARNEDTAAIATAIVLSRLGYNFRNIVNINEVNLDPEEFAITLANANILSREMLDNIAIYEKSGKDVENVRAANSYFRSLERTQTEVSGRNESSVSSGVGNDGETGRVSDESRGDFQPEISANGRELENEVERAGVRETGRESDGVAGADEFSQNDSQRDDSEGSLHSLEELRERTKDISFEQLRDTALEKVAFLNSAIANQRIQELYDLSNSDSPFHEEFEGQLRLAYVANEEEIRLAHENLIDVLRDRVLENARFLDSFNTNEHISAIFERSKNESNSEAIDLTVTLLTSTTDELKKFSDDYLDYLIREGLSGGADLEKRKQEQLEADKKAGLSMSSPVVEYFRIRTPDSLAQEISDDLTFNDVLQQMRAGQDFETITGIGDSFIRQTVFRTIELYEDGIFYSDLYDMDRENYSNRTAEATIETEVAHVAEENTPQDSDEVENVSSEDVPSENTDSPIVTESNEAVGSDDLQLSDMENGSEEHAGQDVVEQQDSVVRYKYYLNQRPADIGSVPNNFESIDAHDAGGRYGAIYYTRPLTIEEQNNYELMPEIEREEEEWQWKLSESEPDFTSLVNGDEDARKYRSCVIMLGNKYKHLKSGEMTLSAFNIYADYTRDIIQFTNEEVTAAFSQYVDGIKDFAGRRDEQEKKAKEALENSAEIADTTATSIAEESSSEVSAPIVEQIEESPAPVRAEEIRTAVDSDANTKEAFRKNLLAIQVLKELESSGRSPSEEEIALMRSYVGFGGLREQVFQDGYKGWENEQQELKQVLTEAEYDALRSSTLTAFYTPPEIIEAIYASLERIGFEKGNILDPSMGSGRFFQNMPEDMRKNSNLFGVELDPLTGRMAKFAYPEAEISIDGFEKTTYPDNSFDMAITNVPFGDYSVYDTGEKGTFKIHDYFIGKMIEQVRPGGIVAVVTSAGTMDKADDSARKFFATKAELLDAVRLPVGAFKSAGTQVGTDILIFKKRQRELSYSEISNDYWIEARDKEDYFSSYDDHMTLNAYFNNNPQQVLGKMKPISTQFGFSLACVPDDDTTPIKERIVNAFSNIRGRYSAAEEELPRPVQRVSREDGVYSFFIDEENNLMFSSPEGDSQPNLTQKQDEKIRGILPLRNRVRALIDMEKDSNATDAMVKEEIERLNQLYDSYYSQYGSVALDKDLKKVFHDDVSYPLMCSLEKIRFDVEKGNVYEGKSDIFSERIIVPHVEPDHADSALDALSISMLEHGKVDLPYMESLTGQSERELLRQLENLHIYYDDEQQEYVHADEYLSGDIRGKIEYLEYMIDELKEEMREYASEKVLPDKTAHFIPRNEIEESIVKDPYKFIRINDDNINFVMADYRQAMDYIEQHIDDKDFSARSLAYLYNQNHGTPEIKSRSNALIDSIVEKYGNDVSFAAAARREGFRQLSVFGALSEQSGFNQLESLKQAMEPKTFAKSYAPKHLDNFIIEKIAEYQGRENELLNLHRYDLTDELEHWIDEKEAEVDAYAEKNLSDKRIKSMMDRINLLEQKKADLEKVKPVDVKADEISVGLGTTWLPTKYIEDFMSDVFDMGWYARSNCKCVYSREAGTWQITNKTQASGVMVENTYGYSSKLNALHLLEQALNFRIPTVKKVIEVDGEEKTVIDEKATMIAQQKQDIIKDEFNKWLFKDKERTQYIVDYYNRHFNSLVPRKFNGEALTFPGMNPNLRLRDHQKNAIAHTLYGGNALFAHTVGAGKTFEMVASAMESKRLGIANKSMIVVPNHLTEQFGAEFKLLYPDANILVATANDFKKDNRKAFCSKIATYNWDAVIIGYTQFERIPMSQEYMEHSLTTQVNELVSAMEKIRINVSDDAQKRYSIRNIETMRKKIEARLEKLRNSPKDQVVKFEDLGIDRLYVDEAHEFKNLFTYTKMSNVAGVSTADAQKTTDLYEKVRYLNKKTGEKGVIFATGTPVSNSMTELYTMMRYLEPSKLEKMGIDSFDAWASTFGETTTGFELRPEGKGFQRKTRFAKFNNMPELMALFQNVADIKTQDMLNLDVPEAEYIVEKLEPSQEQKLLIDALVERAEAIDKGSPKEIMTKDGEITDDNFLWITTEGKKLALDQRLLNPMLPDDPNSKVNKCVENVLGVYQESNDIKGTQLIFCDMSTPSNDGSFNVYNDIKEKLIARGVKDSEVAFIHDAKDEAAKAKLFAKVRSGEVRVLLGSTKKMGTGTNVQDLLVASHDLDVPWRPADLEQRSGRTIRQGNRNKNVKIFRYVTKGTFDAYLWQTLENKQRFISQVMTSKSPLRTIDDCDEATLSYAEIKAVSIGNPHIKEKLDLDNEISRLMLSKADFIENRKVIQTEATRTIPAAIKAYEEYYDKLNADIEFVAQNTTQVAGHEVFRIKLNEKTFSDRKEAGEYLAQCLKDGSYKKLTGEYKGMKLSCSISHDAFSMGECQLVASHKDSYRVNIGVEPVDNMKRLEHQIQSLPAVRENIVHNLEEQKHRLETARKEINRTWPLEDKLQACLKRVKELNKELLDDNKELPVVEGQVSENVTARVACR